MQGNDVSSNCHNSGSLFKKLIKYEFMATWKIMAVIIGAILIIAAAGQIYYALLPDIVKSMPYGGGLDTISGILGVLYVMMIVAAGMGAVIYIAVRFYRNMYTDAGYLTNTLPVGKSALIMSKLTAACIWLLAAEAAIIISVIIFTSCGNAAENTSDLVYEFTREFDGMSTISYVIAIVEMLITVLAGIAAGILEIYAAISLGQMSDKHRVFMSILWYIVFYVIIQIIGIILIILLSTDRTIPSVLSGISGINGKIGYFYIMYMGFVLIVSLLLGAVFYGITYYTAKRKLNLA